jgi:hypothetical protein
VESGARSVALPSRELFLWYVHQSPAGGGVDPLGDTDGLVERDGLTEGLVVGLVEGERLGEGLVGLGEDGVGEPVRPPVHSTPLRVKLAGTGLLPAHEPLNPRDALAPVAMVAL